MLAFTVALFMLGLSLARFGVLAALVATALSTAVSFVYDMTDGETVPQALLLSVFLAMVLQVGYLIGQVLPPVQR